METFFLNKYTAQQSSVVTIGAFDGIHLGHQAVLKTVVEDARSSQATSVLLTFGDHPRAVTAGQKVDIITTPQQRAEILTALRLDRLIIIEDETIFDYSAERFVDHIIAGKLKAKEVVTGFNFRFGKGRAGDTEFLRRRGILLGFRVKVVDPVRIGSTVVSSSAIRSFLAEGRVEEAAEYLGRPYEVRGKVVSGEGRGRRLGFPTANLQPDNVPLVAFGVYVIGVVSPEPSLNLKHEIKALASYGIKPTFQETGTPSLEVYIPALETDLYGARLHIQFLKRIRPEKKFKSEEELVAAIKEDIKEL